METFAEVELRDVIQTNLANAGHITPTEIQSLALPPALSGQDLIACAQTGGGKTAVFAIPIINKLERSDAVKPRRLSWSPHVSWRFRSKPHLPFTAKALASAARPSTAARAWAHRSPSFGAAWT